MHNTLTASRPTPPAPPPAIRPQNPCTQGNASTCPHAPPASPDQALNSFRSLPHSYLPPRQPNRLKQPPWRFSVGDSGFYFFDVGGHLGGHRGVASPTGGYWCAWLSCGRIGLSVSFLWVSGAYEHCGSSRLLEWLLTGTKERSIIEERYVRRLYVHTQIFSFSHS